MKDQSRVFTAKCSEPQVYFDTVNQDKLISILREKVNDSHTLHLIRSFLKVSAEKTKVVRPTKSKFLGFTFWKNADKWKCKPTKDRKANLYSKAKKILLRKKAVAKPIGITFRELNQLISGWINYFKIGSMKKFIEENSFCYFSTLLCKGKSYFPLHKNFNLSVRFSHFNRKFTRVERGYIQNTKDVVQYW